MSLFHVHIETFHPIFNIHWQRRLASDCDVLPDVLNGSVDISDGTTYMSTALYSCDIGHYIVGNSTRTCAEDALWTPTEPYCQIHGDTQQCELEHTWIVMIYLLPFRRFTKSIRVVIAFYLNAFYTVLICFVGIVVEFGKIDFQTFSTCWWHSFSFLLFSDCGILPPVPNGAVNQSGGQLYMDIAHFSCDLGFNLQGTSARTCGSDGTWDNEQPTCEIAGTDGTFTIWIIKLYYYSFLLYYLFCI